MIGTLESLSELWLDGNLLNTLPDVRQSCIIASDEEHEERWKEGGEGCDRWKEGGEGRGSVTDGRREGRDVRDGRREGGRGWREGVGEREREMYEKCRS